MLRVTFALNFTMQQTYLPKEKEDVYIFEGYDPLIRCFEQNPGIKGCLYFDGFTSLRIAEIHPGLVERVRAGVERGQFEIGTYTYNHPILSLLPQEDSYRQVARGLEIDRAVWGVRPRGILLPEGGYDPGLVKILVDLGLEYILMGPRTFHRDNPTATVEDLHRSYKLVGIFGSGARAVMTDDAVLPTETQVYICGGIMQGGEESANQFKGRFTEITGEGDGEGLIVASKNDADFVYSDSLKKKYGPDERWAHYGESLGDLPFENAEDMSRGWAQLAALDDVKFTTVGEYIDEFPPAREISLRPAFGWYKSFQEWLGGSEKVGYVIDEARNEIKHAEYALKLAARLGMDTKAAEAGIAEAWDHLLLAEISVGRRACAHVGGRPSRVVYSMEEALTAKRLAVEAIDLVETT
ncbi:MAG: polysaccharide deacetylase family protein [Planctomycetota bacterium]|jgi:hypothetical protein